MRINDARAYYTALVNLEGGAKMLKAKKGNRVVRIPDEKRKEYQLLGYKISDMSGNVLYEPTDPKKEVESLKAQLDVVKKEKIELEEKLKEAETASGARMDLFNSTRDENEALKSENAGLKGKLEEASAYAKKADKRIAELEGKLKEASKQTKASGTKKAEAAEKAPDAGNKAGEKPQADK